MFASVFSSAFGDLTRMKHKNSNNALALFGILKGNYWVTQIGRDVTSVTDEN
jgi:hypothetical protein